MLAPRIADFHAGNFGLPFRAGPEALTSKAYRSPPNEALSPIENVSLGAIPSRHFHGRGFNLMAAITTPHNQANMGSRRIPECHRLAGIGFHRCR
jgi:hypothetical protein